MNAKLTRHQLMLLTNNFAKSVGFEPHPLQQEILNTDKRFITWVSGARSGKSILAGLMIGAEVVLPDRRIWIVAPSYSLARKEFEYALGFLQKYFLYRENGEKVRFADICKINIPVEGSCSIKTPFGSFIETKSTENSKSLLGEELDTLVLAEAALIPREPYNRMLVGRIGSRIGRQIAFSTGAGDVSLFADFVKNGEGDDKYPDWITFRSNTQVNPYFSKEEFERNKAVLDEKTFNEQFGGELVSKRDYVFNADLNKIVIPVTQDSLNTIRHLPTFLSVKFKYNNFSSVVFVSFDKATGTYYVVKEITGEKQLLSYYLDEAKNHSKLLTKCLGYITDYYDRSTIAEFKTLNTKVITNGQIEKPLGASKSIQYRVKRIQEKIAAGKLKIFDCCPNTISEFKKCKWPDIKKEGSDLLESETPLLKFFCCLEAVSHVITYMCGVK